MMGEELNGADFSNQGLLGDRSYALVDTETGKVASAKNPKKWPDLFHFRASYIDPPQPGHEIPPCGSRFPMALFAEAMMQTLTRCSPAISDAR